MRDYGKVFSRIWESADFRALSEDGRSLALYLLTCQHGTIAGVFRVPDGYACEDLQWTAERVAEGFRDLSEKGFATRCEESKWVWVRKFMEWNPPENPNQRKAAAKCATGIPDQCAWKRDFMRVSGPLLGLEDSEKANPSTTVPKPLLNQEQEQEQKQKGSASRKTFMPDGFEISERVRVWAATKGHGHLDEQFEAFVSYVRRCGPKYVDWDEALMTAIRDNWAKVPASAAADQRFAGLLNAGA